MDNQLTISTATVQDIPALCALLGILFCQEVEFEADIVAQRRGLSEIITNPQTGKILVARFDTNVVGMINLLFSVSTALGGKVAWLEDMIIHPNWRNRGIGSSLLETALEHCRAEGMKRITLLTDSDNLAAQRFYRQHGFSESKMLPMRCLLEN